MGLSKSEIGFRPWGIRAILNVRPDTWPVEPIDATKPVKWQTRRLIKNEEDLAPYCPGKVYHVKESLERDSLPGVAMPHEAARLFIRMREVQAERVQDISEADCYAEGCPPINSMRCVCDPQEWFSCAFENCYGDDAWGANPFVWVYSFELQGAGVPFWFKQWGPRGAGKTLGGWEWLQAPEPVATILQAHGKEAGDE